MFPSRSRLIADLNPLTGAVAQIVLVALMHFVAASLAQCAEPTGARPPARTDIQIESGYSVGNYHLFAYDDNRHILPFGVEMNHPVFGRLFRAELDYVSEALPVVLLNEPAKYGPDGRSLTSGRKWQYGAGISPLGFRLIWRRRGFFQPYGIAKGDILYFQNRVLSTQGTHLQFGSEIGLGVQKAVNARLGYRVGFSDFHVSNGNIGRRNPGIDFMYFTGSLTCRLGK
jgi:hypothetical protein